LPQLPGKAGCVTERVRRHCARTRKFPIVESIAVSGDGRNVYVASGSVTGAVAKLGAGGARGGRSPASLRTGARSGLWQCRLGVRLAERGWQVTGVDVVEKALRRARERVTEAGVEMRLVQGDVTALRQADVGSGFRLVLDTGTIHGLTDAQQEAMGREVNAICADDATVLLDCFAPRRRGPLPRGASRADVERAFPGWEITNVEVADTEPDALARLFKFEERFYRLRRGAYSSA
jgi:Methyltransferase domain